MPYTNEFQYYLDIFSLSLSLKKNSNWFLADNKQNYPKLFSLYIRMLEQDQQEFFAQSTDRQRIIQSLKKSQKFYSFTSDKQLLQTLEQMNTNDPTDFILLPLHYSQEEEKNFHTSGMLIYKEEKSYKFILVDKQYLDSQIEFVKIPPENLPSLCRALFFDRDNPNFVKAYNIIYEIFAHAFPKVLFQLSYQMHLQKEGNCIIKEIEATLKTALFHCRHDLFALQNSNKIKWNDRFDSSLEMREHFLAAIKKEFKGPSKPFDLLFNLYKQRKEKNCHSYLFSPLETKKMIHQEIQNEMNKYPKIQQILSGKKIYETGGVNKRIDFFSKLTAERESNTLKIEHNIPQNIAKEKVMLFEKIAKAKEKIETNFQENSKNKNTKSQVPLIINR